MIIAFDHCTWREDKGQYIGDPACYGLVINAMIAATSFDSSGCGETNIACRVASSFVVDPTLGILRSDDTLRWGISTPPERSFVLFHGVLCASGIRAEANTHMSFPHSLHIASHVY